MHEHHKTQMGWILGKSKVSFKERLDGANVFPVVGEEVCLNMITIGSSFWDDLTTKVVILWVFKIQEIEKRGLLKDINAHGCDVRRGLCFIVGQTKD